MVMVHHTNFIWLASLHDEIKAYSLHARRLQDISSNIIEIQDDHKLQLTLSLPVYHCRQWKS